MEKNAWKTYQIKGGEKGKSGEADSNVENAEFGDIWKVDASH